MLGLGRGDGGGEGGETTLCVLTVPSYSKYNYHQHPSMFKEQYIMPVDLFKAVAQALILHFVYLCGVFMLACI